MGIPYKYLVKLFRYSRDNGYKEEDVMFMRFDSSKPPFPIVYPGKEVPGDEIKARGQ